ncbi:hypothetical protein BOTBODRAFT_27214 [Botryobasidium botryosum FD-172 SS1]|uniref:AB hydrolase-1 domain-containing protein n=1 Tax=Botryobasidium botryosum (strain FD-172 SS1) TaxID=930990 RepID=A0A067MVM8_BOTB1|nr:hypothetical protein BOTBODRAFT_27214 [Botryobasidium botryosum FD-172 SS1]
MSHPELAIIHTDLGPGTRIHSRFRPSTAPNTQLPLLVLLHGYPQNSSMYLDFVSQIPPEWDILIPDLPGYGQSTKPPSPDGSSRAHSKREWAKDIMDVVDAISEPGAASRKIIAYGHDRGGRLAYRMALDFPERVVGLAVLDIVPTSYVWNQMSIVNFNHAETLHSHHWIFLSSPSPLPETLINSNVDFYMRYTISSWLGTAQKNKSLNWVEKSIQPYTEPDGKGAARVTAACEDYRAGATIDLQNDLHDLDPFGHSTPKPFAKIPVLFLLSNSLQTRFDAYEIWESFCSPEKLRTHLIGPGGSASDTVGHFLVNEAPEEVESHTRDWLKEFWGET